MTTFENVKEIIVDTLSLDADEIKLESDLINDLGIDSLDVMELVMAIDEKCNVTIPDEEIPNLTTVEAIVNYIDANKAA
ncbi:MULTISPECIES: acyl carrier protein [Lachnospira]|jgi:acyl carrier protein|uniref:Acyl carrier protein n=2 Tax=Lachnospira TaxID=28050 RepID=A0A1H5UHN3_9FIRM|nr:MULTISPECIES: acyl carrier protein [Lachnospira]MCR5516891.1 acyl carrier protein [Lachnospira sp.]SDM86698.1 acyl carrier protein [Lachnospira pectinoschiza]SEF74565.1 acyl carrier protein [Lachnospira multipara]